MTEESIDVLLQEGRTFPPPPEFAAQAVVNDRRSTTRRRADLDAFWLARTREFVGWFEPPTMGLEWDPPHCTWFADGTLNASHSCLDRHVEAGRGDQVAYHFVPEDPRRGARATSPIASCATTSAGSPTPCASSVSARATPSASTWAWCPRRPWRCWPAPGSARRTWSCSAASRRARWASGWRAPSAKLVITQDEAWRKGDRDPAQGDRRRRRRHGADRRADGRAAPHRRRRADVGRPRRLVARRGGRPVGRVRGGAGRGGAHAVRAAHVRYDRQAKGRGAHHRRLPDVRDGHPPLDFDIKDGDTYWCAAASAGSPATRTSSTARSTTA